MTRPMPRPASWALEKDQGAFTSPTSISRFDQPTHTLNGPMSHDGHVYSATSFRCHDFASSSPVTTIIAGGVLDIEWLLPAAHPGDCSLWISYDADKEAPSNW